MILDVHYPLTYRFKPGDEIPGLPQGGPASHAQFFNEKVAGIMHRRMADIFTHLNPYTKKRYCDDPTIAMVEVLNEDSLFWGEIAAAVPAGTGAEVRRLAAEEVRRRCRVCERPGRWTAKSPLAEGEGLGSGQRINLLEARSS